MLPVINHGSVKRSASSSDFLNPLQSCEPATGGLLSQKPRKDWSWSAGLTVIAIGACALVAVTLYHAEFLTLTADTRKRDESVATSQEPTDVIQQPDVLQQSDEIAVRMLSQQNGSSGSSHNHSPHHANSPTEVEYGEWQDKDLEDLFGEYNNIFPHGNRNAASHRWATFILEKSQQLSFAKLEEFFSGFCPVSGSPVTPSQRSLWTYSSLSATSGNSVSGTIYHCCWPCVCDTKTYLKVDTKTIQTAEGSKEYNFLVYGDPCTDPSSIPAEAPDVNCANGHLTTATKSDGGYIIVGMVHEGSPIGLSGSAASAVDAQCAQREQDGFNSGMGTIFVQVAGINPI